MPKAEDEAAKFGQPVWPSYEEIDQVLHLWEGKHPETMKLEELGKSSEGRPVYAVTLTDPSIDADKKEHALITALHVGLERSAGTTVMVIIEWLLSDDPAAREVLKNQVIVCMPIADPDRYMKGEVSPVYGGLNTKGPIDPKKGPESGYLQIMMDRLEPELHADIHGTNLDFEKYIMFESSGTSYSNFSLRPFRRDIVRLMDEAALVEGYPSDTAEDDAERLFYGPGLANMPERLWVGRPRFYAATYAYYHFHSLISASEVAWERSGLLRHQRLLKIGNERWPGEYYPGYPTRVIMGNTHARITAYGKTAAERRSSRVELWNRMGEFAFGSIDPAVEGKAMCILATSVEAEERYLSDPSLGVVVTRLQENPNMDGKEIGHFSRGWPKGQNYPKAWFALQKRTVDKNEVAPKPIAKGLSVRLRLPYGKSKISDLRLNGSPVKKSEVDGYVTWVSRSSRYIQVNLSPERLKKEDVFLVTCDYDPQIKRGHWDYKRYLSEK